MVRDPSSILIAFVLPAVLLLLFAYGINLDSEKLPIGILNRSHAPEAQRIVAAFSATDTFRVRIGNDQRQLVDELTAGKVRAILEIPTTFNQTTNFPQPDPLLLLTDGSETNTAAFVQNFAEGILSERQRDLRLTPNLQIRQRIWYNPDLSSSKALLPGSLAIVMAIVGTLLTSLVVAREWERGTMEALLSTPVSATGILVAKVIPYFILGILSFLSSFLATHLLFGVPFQGSITALLLSGITFLFSALGQGFLISTAFRSQFLASMVALITAFLPAFLLSGFVFEISSMPLPIQKLTLIIPARFFVANLQTVFLVGDVWPLILPNSAYLLLLGCLFFLLTKRVSSSTLDPR
jgi:ABC-2 type transport system permease protein